MLCSFLQYKASSSSAYIHRPTTAAPVSGSCVGAVKKPRLKKPPSVPHFLTAIFGKYLPSSFCAFSQVLASSSARSVKRACFVLLLYTTLYIYISHWILFKILFLLTIPKSVTLSLLLLLPDHTEREREREC